jgi:hypothetical protein
MDFDDHSPSQLKVQKMDDESVAASSGSRTTKQGSRQLTFPPERIVDNENDIFMREVEAMQEEENEEDLAAKVNEMIVTQFGGRRKREASKKNVENESDEDENNAEDKDFPLAAYPKRHQGEFDLKCFNEVMDSIDEETNNSKRDYFAKWRSLFLINILNELYLLNHVYQQQPMIYHLFLM